MSPSARAKNSTKRLSLCDGMLLTQALPFLSSFVVNSPFHLEKFGECLVLPRIHISVCYTQNETTMNASTLQVPRVRNIKRVERYAHAGKITWQDNFVFSPNCHLRRYRFSIRRKPKKYTGLLEFTSLKILGISFQHQRS